MVDRNLYAPGLQFSLISYHIDICPTVKDTIAMRFGIMVLAYSESIQTIQTKLPTEMIQTAISH